MNKYTNIWCIIVIKFHLQKKFISLYMQQTKILCYIYEIQCNSDTETLVNLIKAFNIGLTMRLNQGVNTV